MQSNTLHWADWLLFGLVILLSVVIGLFPSLIGGRQKSVSGYLQGDGHIRLIPTAISLTVSYISSILILGYPAEVYTFGAQYWLSCFASFLSATIACLIYVPVFYPLRMISVNEYILKRFKSRVPLTLISIYSVLMSLLYSAIVSFGQATCIEAVSGCPIWVSILIANFAAVIYTSLGGLKGVVWADVFQAVVLLIGLVVVLAQALVSVGGFGKAFKINGDWGRLNFFVWDPSPTVRMNFYGVVFGNALSYASIDGHNQPAFQRYSSQPTLRRARLTLFLALPCTLLLRTLAVLTGVALFAYYTNLGCDPIEGGQIDNPNQIVPYFVMEKLNHPGLQGLFLACVSAGALSTTSSIFNSQSALIWDDTLKHYIKVSDRKAALILQCLAMLCGIVSALLAFLAAQLGGNLMQMMSTFSSAMGGPMAGVFLLGFFIPWANSKGATVGCLIGTVFSCWVAFGSYSIDKQYSNLPVNTANCTSDNFQHTNATGPYGPSFLSTVTTSLPESENAGKPDWLVALYSLSFLWMKEVATLLTIVIAIIVSFVTGATKPDSVKKELYHPWIRGCIKRNDENNIKLKGFDDADDMEREKFLRSST